ncbi:helix-turn-helix transcriptional regulator [Marinomonas spartinae]|uniref:helix-turn-helix transcriptional regulator n=1 Tax=Marinomonas spartinae TaxID=1792290 RepID=UPI0018F1C42A|nr:LuxR C-terminal-related transcriptional regulator [Marinomonas spartinae]MBJ7555422.1 hypothetical protein [Marinomonas spartinae]
MSSTNITFYASKKATLNSTQLEPLVLFAQGFPVKTISHQLGKADPTINHHLVSARHHYNARNTTHAVAIAVARGDIKFKSVSNYTNTLRCGAIAFLLMTGISCYEDTPFVGDIDHVLSRAGRHVKGHKGSRGVKRDFLDIQIV